MAKKLEDYKTVKRRERFSARPVAFKGLTLSSYRHEMKIICHLQVTECQFINLIVLCIDLIFSINNKYLLIPDMSTLCLMLFHII